MKVCVEWRSLRGKSCKYAGQCSTNKGIQRPTGAFEALRDSFMTGWSC
jgi:hypothetical protein